MVSNINGVPIKSFMRCPSEPQPSAFVVPFPLPFIGMGVKEQSNVPPIHHHQYHLDMSSVIVIVIIIILTLPKLRDSQVLAENIMTRIVFVQ